MSFSFALTFATQGNQDHPCTATRRGRTAMETGIAGFASGGGEGSVRRVGTGPNPCLATNWARFGRAVT
jgi:hypothetical protein